MAVNDKEMFRRLEPPPEGLAKLRMRIERGARRRSRRLLVPSVSAGALILILVGWIVLAPVEESEIPSELDLVRIQLGQIPAPSDVLTIPENRRDQVAALRVPLPTDDVVFYLVDSGQ